MHYRDQGPTSDPLPLVLIHGTSASLHTWEGWVAALQTRRRVITFDLPGFGRSDKPKRDSAHDLDWHLQVLRELVQRLGLRRFGAALFRGSSVVERSAVNRLVVGSSPTWGEF